MPLFASKVTKTVSLSFLGIFSAQFLAFLQLLGRLLLHPFKRVFSILSKKLQFGYFIGFFVCLFVLIVLNSFEKYFHRETLFSRPFLGDGWGGGE